MFKRVTWADAATALCMVAILSSTHGCGREFKNKEPALDADVSHNVNVLSEARILFGHQSVGANILSGVQGILTDTTLPRISIVSSQRRLTNLPSFLAEEAIGQNGKPKTKCDAFARTVRTLAGDSLQIACMKFCYTDFGPEIDVNGIFAYYKATITSLKAEFPRMKFVHVTTPLLSESPLWKRAINWVLGRKDSYKVYDARISQYNNLLVSEFESSSVFDLARVESTYPDGSRCTIPGSIPPVYVLVREYTSDGGHLDQTGSYRAAKEFLNVLAHQL